MQIIKVFSMYLLLFCFCCDLVAEEEKKPVKDKEEIILPSASYFGLNAKKENPADIKLRKLLESIKVSVEYEETKFSEVLKFIRKQGISVIVPNAGVAVAVKEATISMHLKDILLKDAIEFLFEFKEFKYKIKSGALVVLNSDDVTTDKPNDPRVYSIADLVEHGMLPEHIIDLIQRLPLLNDAVWDGEIHSVSTDDNGRLIVNTFPKIHDDIAKLLTGMRKYVQISEMRKNHGRYILSQSNLRVGNLLFSKKVSFEFNEAKFSDALNILRKEGLSINVDTANTLKKISNAKITMIVEKVSLLNALEMIAGFQGLGFKLKGGIIILYQKKEDTTALKNSVMELKKEQDILKGKLKKQNILILNLRNSFQKKKTLEK